MIDEQQIRDKYHGDDYITIVEFFQYARKIGFFDTFIEANKRRIIDSFGDDSDEVLAKKIGETRQENRVLTALKSLFTTA